MGLAHRSIPALAQGASRARGSRFRRDVSPHDSDAGCRISTIGGGAKIQTRNGHEGVSPCRSSGEPAVGACRSQTPAFASGRACRHPDRRARNARIARLARRSRAPQNQASGGGLRLLNPCGRASAQVRASLAASKPDELEAEALVDARICAAAGEEGARGRRDALDRRFCGRAELPAACSFATRSCSRKRSGACFRRIAALPSAPATTSELERSEQRRLHRADFCIPRAEENVRRRLGRARSVKNAGVRCGRHVCVPFRLARGPGQLSDLCVATFRESGP